MRPEGRKKDCEEGESVQKKADTRIEERGKSETRAGRCLPSAPEVEVAAGHLDVVVMPCHVFDALCREFGDAFAVEDKVFQLPVDVLPVGQDVDDGA